MKYSEKAGFKRDRDEKNWPRQTLDSNQIYD